MIQRFPFEITLPGYLSWVFLKFGGFCQSLFGWHVLCCTVLSTVLSDIVACCGSEQDGHPAMKQKLFVCVLV